MNEKLNIEPACPGKDEGNIAIPIGLSDTFDKYFDIIGMNDLLNSFKSRDEALSPLIRCMCPSLYRKSGCMNAHVRESRVGY